MESQGTCLIPKLLQNQGGASEALGFPPLRGFATTRSGGKKEAGYRINSDGVQCQTSIAEWCVGFPGIVSDSLKTVSLVLDLLTCVGVLRDVSDLLIFDTCVAVSGFVYPLLN